NYCSPTPLPVLPFAGLKVSWPGTLISRGFLASSVRGQLVFLVQLQPYEDRIMVRGAVLVSREQVGDVVIETAVFIAHRLDSIDVPNVLPGHLAGQFFGGEDVV